MCELYVLGHSPDDDPFLTAFRAVEQMFISARASARGLNVKTEKVGDYVYLVVTGAPEEIVFLVEEIYRETGLTGYFVVLENQQEYDAVKSLHRRKILVAFVRADTF